MPVGVRREIENIERTIAICGRFKRRMAAGEDQAAIIADLAAEYGVNKPAIWRQVHKGSSPTFVALAQEKISAAGEAEDEIESDDPGMIIAPRTWCAQCEKSVTRQRAATCASRFCKAQNASGTLTEGGDVEQAPSDSLSGPTGKAGDAQGPSA